MRVRVRIRAMRTRGSESSDECGVELDGRGLRLRDIGRLGLRLNDRLSHHGLG